MNAPSCCLFLIIIISYCHGATPPTAPEIPKVLPSGTRGEYRGVGNNNPGKGTSIGGTYQQQVYKNGNHEINVGGSYNQHFGGPSGTSHPSLGVGAAYVYRWMN